jgi:murein DD-endopeptidase MepM/ murein hydrolase activator NlpD
MIDIKRNTWCRLTYWFICLFLICCFSNDTAIGEFQRNLRAKKQSHTERTSKRPKREKKQSVKASRSTGKKALRRPKVKSSSNDKKTAGEKKTEKERTNGRSAVVSGTIHTSLYKAMVDLGESAEMVRKYTTILGYDIDFVQESREGDRFRILVERSGSKSKGGKILAAEYVGEVTGTVRAYLYRDHGKEAYYSDEGECLERTFMRSPLSVLRVTSPFGMRVHPISGNYTMHKGTDYGAPVGTPVWAVSSGKIQFAGRNGGYGNLVEITHGSGIVTRYGHLSRISVRSGQKISQGQVIGKVGSTGASTGPHLHFEFLRNGTAVSPRQISNISKSRLTGKLLKAFRAETARLDKLMSGAAKPVRRTKT